MIVSLFVLQYLFKMGGYIRTVNNSGEIVGGTLLLVLKSLIIETCIMGPLSRPRSKILRVAVSRIILSSEASKVKLVGNLVA